MRSSTQFLSSRRGVCSGLIVVMAIVFLALLSSSLGRTTNTSIVEFGKGSEVVYGSGRLEPTGSGLTAGFELGQTINQEASSFIYLTEEVGQALEWTLIIGLGIVFFLAAFERSWMMLLGTAAVTEIVFGLFGGNLWSEVAEIVPWETLACAVLGVGAILALQRWRPFAVRRIPDRVSEEEPMGGVGAP